MLFFSFPDDMCNYTIAPHKKKSCSPENTACLSLHRIDLIAIDHIIKDFRVTRTLKVGYGDDYMVENVVVCVSTEKSFFSGISFNNIEESVFDLCPICENNK